MSKVINFPLSFLLLQDGEALPDGPVVISPDGLFPSLYREGEYMVLFKNVVGSVIRCYIIIAFAFFQESRHIGKMCISLSIVLID